jgi:hypothetical protein
MIPHAGQRFRIHELPGLYRPQGDRVLTVAWLASGMTLECSVAQTDRDPETRNVSIGLADFGCALSLGYITPLDDKPERCGDERRIDGQIYRCTFLPGHTGDHGENGPDGWRSWHPGSAAITSRCPAELDALITGTGEPAHCTRVVDHASTHSYDGFGYRLEWG